MKKAMNQSKLVFLVNLVTAVLLVAILASLGMTALQSIKADNLNEDRFLLTENATKFMGVSALLTSEVRAYSATADKVHYDNYITELEQIKTRETCLEAMKKIGLSQEESAITDEMMSISEQLVIIEKEAIALVDSGELKGAVDLVLGTSYNDQTTKLQALKVEFLNALTTRTSKEVDRGVMATRVFEVQTVVLVVAIILLRVYSYNIVIKKVIRPIIAVENEMRLIAAGDLSSTFDMTPDTSEIGMLIDAILTTKAELRKYIKDISGKLNKMAEQDFSIAIDIDYIGDFHPIKASLTQIVTSLNRALYQIDSTADSVSCGSNQVAEHAQDVAGGTSRQAVAIEEISETFADFSVQIEDTAQKANMATELANEAGVQLGKSNDQLQGMLTAMNEISNASGEIGKIIKTIEDIAFQTNILALNAAVEAARAGSAGKGFAVVADEVRNLANKSAEASKNTSVMIENSLHTIQSGAKIATEASNTFVTVMVNAGRAAEAMSDISFATKGQSEAIRQIAQSINQVSMVIQNNSSTSEESAAVSEQLLRQAEEMHTLVHQFQLLKS